MALYHCARCGRTFTKTEHFKRHERSHTKERPYACTRCDKAFSRSDVLFRHMKCHSPKNPTGPTTNIDGTLSSPAPASTSSVSPLAATHQTPSSVPGNLLGQHRTRNASTGLPGGRLSIDADAAAQNRRVANPRAPMTQRNTPPAESWASGPPGPGTDHAMILLHADMPPPPPHTASNATTTLSGARRDLPNQLEASLEDSSFDWIPHGSTDPGADLSDILQTWLFPTDASLGYQTDLLQTYGGYVSRFSSPHPYAPPVSRVSLSSESSDRTATIGRVPAERFSRVQRCWQAGSSHAPSLMPDIWRNVVSSTTGNLFSVASPSQQPRREASRWGLDAACRRQLLEAFHRPTTSVASSPQQTADREVRPRPHASHRTDFPPTEILDISLDLFFRRVHPITPFIHVPTFDVKTIPISMLFALCMIGLSVLGTDGATDFVSRTFPSFLHHVFVELTSRPPGPITPSQHLTRFATAALTLNLAAMTGNQDVLAQSRILYVTLLAMVQQDGLFTTNTGHDLLPALATITELDPHWKAWSRIESAKRLIVGILLVDSWFANHLSVRPVVRTEAVSVIAPCDDILFQARSAAEWKMHLHNGKEIYMPMISLNALDFYKSLPVVSLGPLGNAGLLALLQLRVLESHHRIVAVDPPGPQTMVPAHRYQNDACASSLVGEISATWTIVAPPSRSADTNCVVLWNSLCIMLLSDFRLFDLAAGRAGAEPATDALEKIAQWSQTAAARRACVHAAQNFKLMSNRRVSDVVTIQSVTALFASALVLGLYVFMTAPVVDRGLGHGSTPGEKLVELVDVDLDWDDLAGLGFSAGFDNMEHEHSPARSQSHAEIAHFINHGGTVTLSGIPRPGGYESARRVLLDFANLMEGTSRREMRTFTQILHIMGDDLMHIDSLS